MSVALWLTDGLVVATHSPLVYELHAHGEFPLLSFPFS
jgi:hypothetical protein